MEKWAVITGASSGIGCELAKLYAKRGYSLVIAARRKERLDELVNILDTKVIAVECDLSKQEDCFKLYDSTQNLNVELLINNAGFGAVGKFDDIDLKRQTDMINVNCTAVTTLTHLFLKDFKYRGCGAILNVASSSGFLPGGPNMAVYYASKAYVVSLTNAVCEELRSCGSAVRIAALCPGPVDTEFNDVADGKFAMKGITPQYAAKCAALGLDKGERIIVPEPKITLIRYGWRFLPERLVLKLTGWFQKRKQG